MGLYDVKTHLPNGIDAASFALIELSHSICPVFNFVTAHIRLLFVAGGRVRGFAQKLIVK
jgi:hypothetical protein